MKLGLGSYGLAWAIGVPGSPPAHPMGWRELLRAASTLEVRVVQIADNIPLDTLSTSELTALADEARARSIHIEVGTRGIAYHNLRSYLELAERFDSPFVRVVVDTTSHHPTPDEVVSLLRPMMPDFEQAGIYLAIENHDRFRATTLRQIIRQLESQYAGVCLDTVNSFGSLEGPQIVLEALGSYVVNLHVKDFKIRRAYHNMGFVIEGTPAGQGQLDMPWLLSELHSRGRDVNAILELWPPPEVDVEATIRKEWQWAQESVIYLRGLISE